MYLITRGSDVIAFFRIFSILEVGGASAAKFTLGLSKSLPSILCDLPSAGKLLGYGAYRTCGGLFLIGMEIVVKPHDGDAFPSSLTAKTINSEGAIIC